MRLYVGEHPIPRPKYRGSAWPVFVANDPENLISKANEAVSQTLSPVVCFRPGRSARRGEASCSFTREKKRSLASRPCILVDLIVVSQ